MGTWDNGLQRVAVRLLFVVAAWKQVSASCVGAVSLTEYNALEALYNSTNGAGWRWKNISDESIWTFPSPLSSPCSLSWQGILCEASANAANSSCGIVSVSLSEYDLRGPLPAEIYLLDSLIVLDLAINRIEGE
jgi:hypothetical protein